MAILCWAAKNSLRGTGIVFFSVADPDLDPDPHYFWKLDPDSDPHKSGKLNPDL